MLYASPSLISRHTLRSGVQSTQSQLRQLFPQHGALFTPLRTTPKQALQRAFHGAPFPVVRAVRNAGAKDTKGLSFLLKGATIAGVGLGLANQRSSIIHCEAPQAKPNPPPVYPDELGPPPASSVSVYELGFGTVAGICAGVFLKKGAKALAFLFGGVFVLLQYLGSASIVRVDWGRAATKFEDAFHSIDPKTRSSRPPSVFRLWNWLIDFLTADFQPRASFVAGFALGLRIG